MGATTTTTRRKASWKLLILGLILLFVGIHNILGTSKNISSTIFGDNSIETTTTHDNNCNNNNNVTSSRIIDKNDNPSVSSSSIRKKKIPSHYYYPPVDCDAVRFHYQTNKSLLYDDHDDPNHGQLHVIRTFPAKIESSKVHYPFWISLHNEIYDPTRWSIVENRYYYEHKLTHALERIILSKKKETTTRLKMIDIGGNIGWFSLLSISTAIGTNQTIEIRSFEPNPKNQLRFCESLHINGWWNDHDHNDQQQQQHVVKLYPYGVTNYKLSGTNISMDMRRSGTGTLLKDDPNAIGDDIQTVSLVSLDQMNKKVWKEYSTNSTTNDRILILKVDVEGLELDVFRGAKKLIQSGRIENIFFEGNIRNEKEMIQFRELCSERLVQSGYRLYMYGGWKGPEIFFPQVTMNETNTKDVNEYVFRILKECSLSDATESQCNMWWRHSKDDDSILLDTVLD